MFVHIGQWLSVTEKYIRQHNNLPKMQDRFSKDHYEYKGTMRMKRGQLKLKCSVLATT